MSGVSKDWIQTATGKKFFPLNPDPESIDIVDIAHALGNVCRYTGHASRFYSVAEHSVRVSRRVHVLTGDRALALQGLMHDASEAYIADIARPVKHQPEMRPYRDIELTLQTAIYQRFGLPTVEHATVSLADAQLLGIEATHLMSPMHPDWPACAPPGAFPPAFEPDDPLGWDPMTASLRFMMQFKVLTLRPKGVL